jgi:Protein of unknown function (DUF3592)
MNLMVIVGTISLALGFALGGLLRWRGVRGGIVLAILALVTLLAGGLLLPYSAPEISASIASRDWPVTEGVVSDTTRVGERAILPLVTYTYQVSGVSYTASTDLAVPGFGSKRYRGQTASKILAAYPPGRAVTVHYDPADPGKSALRPGLRWAPLMRFTVGAMLLLAFGALAPVARWKRV